MFSKKDDGRYTSDFNAMINIAILNSLGFFFIGFLIPVISRQNMNASGLEVGFVVSALVLGNMITSSFIGILTDKAKSKRYLIFLGSIGRGLSYFVLYFSIIINSLIGIWIGMLVLGSAAGLFWIPFDTLVAEKSNKNHRSHAYGKRDAANAMGQLIGALTGFSLLMFVSGFSNNPSLLYSAIVIFGVSNIIAGFLFLTRVDESIKFYDIEVDPNSHKNNQSPQLRAGFNRIIIIGIIVLLFVVLLSSINGNVAKPFLNIYILENLNENLNIVILIYLPAGLLATFFAPKLGEYIDKLKPSVAITITSVSGAIVTWLLINTQDLIIFAILLLLDLTIAISVGLLFRNLLSRINVEHRGKILGLCTLFVELGAFIGPIYGGFVWDNYGPKAPFIVSIYVELLLIPLYLIVIRLLLPHLAETYEKREKSKE
jgi:MFS family permease